MKCIQKVLEILSSLMLVVAVLAVSAGVLWRYVLRSSLTYTFELSMLLYAYIIFLGINLALEEQILIGVDILTVRLPKEYRRVCAALSEGIMLVISLAMAYQGGRLVMATNAQLSALQISIRYLYAAVPIGFGVFALHNLFRLVRRFLRRAEGEVK